MAKVNLIFEDTPEGLSFEENFSDGGAPGDEPSLALVLGAVVVKLVEELIGAENLEESGS